MTPISQRTRTKNRLTLHKCFDMNYALTKRDIALLLSIYKHRYLSVSQVHTLHFPSRRTAYTRLQVLTANKYLKAFTVPHIPERIYYIDKRGAEIIALELQTTLDALQWQRSMKAPKDYYFLRHFLAINDFRILITRACLENSMTLLGFIPEYYGDKTIEGNVVKYIRDRVCDIGDRERQYSHTPDAVFALEKADKAALFFLEIDRGNEVISNPEKGFLKAVVFYLNYWVERKYQRYQEDFGNKNFQFARTLMITPSKDRLEHIRHETTKLAFHPAYVKRFLWITTEEKATKYLIFEPIWNSLDATDPTLYKIG